LGAAAIFVEKGSFGLPSRAVDPLPNVAFYHVPALRSNPLVTRQSKQSAPHTPTGSAPLQEKRPLTPGLLDSYQPVTSLTGKGLEIAFRPGISRDDLQQLTALKIIERFFGPQNWQRAVKTSGVHLSVDHLLASGTLFAH
jgi:hypothetical protein